MTAAVTGRVVLVTGLQASGKTTVGRALAARLGPPAAHFDGDVLDDMVVAGHAPMTPDPSPEARRQLELRYRASARLARFYADHGFDVVVSDIVLGAYVALWVSEARGARVVVLDPDDAAIVAREQGRGGRSYRDWVPPGGTLADGVAALRRALDETPREVGDWLDTGDLTVEQTVEAILVTLGR